MTQNHQSQMVSSEVVEDDEVDHRWTHQEVAVACMIEDVDVEEEMAVKDSETLPLYNLKQKETVDDVKVNPALTVKQQEEVGKLLTEYKEIFSDVPKVTHLIEHKVELTEKEPVKHKPYPMPYKMQEIMDKEIDEMLKMGIIEHSEVPYASQLMLVKKSDGTYTYMHAYIRTHARTHAHIHICEFQRSE